MNVNLNEIKIVMDPGVRHISKTACMAISGAIENGLILSGTSKNVITIYKDRIDFGKSITPELENVYGFIIVNFYREYGNIVYRFGSNLKCSFFSKTIEYKGVFPPEEPDNIQLFNLIYPKFS